MALIYLVTVMPYNKAKLVSLHWHSPGSRISILSLFGLSCMVYQITIIMRRNGAILLMAVPCKVGTSWRVGHKSPVKGEIAKSCSRRPITASLNYNTWPSLRLYAPSLTRDHHHPRALTLGLPTLLGRTACDSMDEVVDGYCRHPYSWAISPSL